MKYGIDSRVYGTTAVYVHRAVSDYPPIVLIGSFIPKFFNNRTSLLMDSNQSEQRASRISFAPSWCSPVCSAASLKSELASEICRTIEKHCGRRPLQVRETTAAPGQTNRHFRVDFPYGNPLLVKAARPQTAPDVANMRFLGEQTALEWLRRYSGSLVVPHGLGVFGTRTPLSLIGWVELAPFGLWMAGGQAKLGKAMGELHTSSMLASSEEVLQRFGFGVDTCLGQLRLVNKWDNDWVRFFIEQRLAPRLQDALLLCGAQYGTSNADANALRSVAERIQDVGRVRWALFDQIRVVPALLHGDLFSGNCGITKGKRE
eukprot:IDg14515t1